MSPREVLVVRRRELRAEGLGEHAADQEEHERRDQVLDPDHLVVGVDLEVVAPAVGAVVGVALGELRADDVLRPVVEAADAGDEAERHDQHQAGRDDLVLEPRPADREAHERRDRDRDDRGDDRPDQRAPPAGAREDAAAAARISVRRDVRAGRSGDDAHPEPPFARYATRSSICLGLRSEPNSWGMMPGAKPLATNAFGSTIDSLMKPARSVALVLPAAFASSKLAVRSSSFGPGVAGRLGRRERVAAAAARGR